MLLEKAQMTFFYYTCSVTAITEFWNIFLITAKANKTIRCYSVFNNM